MTFGFQAQRMDANERERTYGSLATFGFSNAQTAGFSPDGDAADGRPGTPTRASCSASLNATNVIEDSASRDERPLLPTMHSGRRTTSR